MDESDEPGVKGLPVYQGWTVDVRLRQFRRVTAHGLVFLDFWTEEGDELLNELIGTLDVRVPEERALLEDIWR